MKTQEAETFKSERNGGVVEVVIGSAKDLDPEWDLDDKVVTFVKGLERWPEFMPGKTGPDFYYDVRQSPAQFAAALFQWGYMAGLKDGEAAKAKEIRAALGL